MQNSTSSGAYNYQRALQNLLRLMSYGVLCFDRRALLRGYVSIIPFGEESKMLTAATTQFQL
jgi:hypothetical protein